MKPRRKFPDQGFWSKSTIYRLDRAFACIPLHGKMGGRTPLLEIFSSRDAPVDVKDNIPRINEKDEFKLDYRTLAQLRFSRFLSF